MRVLLTACPWMPRHYDSPDLLQRKIKFLAKHIQRSKHFVVYTGAGISTAAKIPDFRGPNGVWTARDRGKAAPKSVSMEQAIPTYAHNCLVRFPAVPAGAYLVCLVQVKLAELGTMKYLTSQNVDGEVLSCPLLLTISQSGLHRRSGIKADAISELHGNCFIEKCANPKCQAEYLRNYDVCNVQGPYFQDVEVCVSCLCWSYNWCLARWTC